MKINIYIIAFVAIATISCKAQTIRTLGDTPVDLTELPKPIYTKDQNNIRDSFVGVWQGVQGDSELTIYLYELDGVPVGILGSRGESFVDAVMGYYIYKENGVEVINSRNNLLLIEDGIGREYGPIFGITSDGVEMTSMRFVDYGIQVIQDDGSPSIGKQGTAEMIISNTSGSPTQASFSLKNPIRGLIGGTYNLNFSIPTSLTLNKISDTPPPLE